jgi:hypothetical protein
VNRVHDFLAAWWPYISGGGIASWWGIRQLPWVARKLRLGASHIQLAREIAEREAEVRESEHTRATLRVMISDLNLSYDRMEHDLSEARKQMRIMESILEMRSANEWILYHDRDRALTWGRTLAAQLARLDQPVLDEPQMDGIPVAEPDEIAIERFMRRKHDNAPTLSV